MVAFISERQSSFCSPKVAVYWWYHASVGFGEEGGGYRLPQISKKQNVTTTVITISPPSNVEKKKSTTIITISSPLPQTSEITHFTFCRSTKNRISRVIPTFVGIEIPATTKVFFFSNVGVQKYLPLTFFSSFYTQQKVEDTTALWRDYSTL